uniref:Innexin n=1 Tax=Dugesia japonica TaxID=6161 RepID=Q2L6N0_DUGJA|nr:innexin4 [Dugesia japonica]
MDATFVRKLAKLGRLGSSHLRYDDDFIDRLNYQITGILLFLFIGIIGIRQYVGKPIQCWSPQEFTRGWEEYAENYCWVSNTYYASVSNRLPDKPNRKDLMIGYYQWAWIFLGVQALMFYIPCILWRGLYNQSRFNIRRIIQMSASATDIIMPLSEKNGNASSNTSIKFIAKYLDSCIRRRHLGRCKPDKKLNNNIKPGHQVSTSWCCSHKSGNCLTILYLLIKLLYILNAISQVYLMEIFIGTKYTFYGVYVLKDLLRGLHWADSGHFPRVTFCDFQAKKLGKNHLYTLQCVLPINMILEKVFIILWFWIVLLFIINIFSFINWTGRLLQSRFRVQFIRKHLHIMGTLVSSDRPMSRHFVEHYLGADVVFIIRLISTNSCEFVASQLANELWMIYRHRRHAELEDMKFGHASLSPSQKSKLSGVCFGNSNRCVPLSSGVNNDDVV